MGTRIFPGAGIALVFLLSGAPIWGMQTVHIAIGSREEVDAALEAPPADCDSLECECQGECQCEAECERDPADDVSFDDWLGYNSSKSRTTWLAADEFGMFSSESFPTLSLGDDSALVMGTGFHFLNGPVSPTDMPPRLFDLQFAYHARKAFSSNTMLDIKFGVGAFTDFEGSVRKGIRFPGHAVLYHEWDRSCVSVLGVDVLDRDDITLLPVAGFVLQPDEDLLFELVFPRPRISLRLDDHQAMYVGGELGGGTWAIEREDLTNDNATYRDLRITFGVRDFSDGSDGVLEVGWAFDRSLKYRSGRNNADFEGAFILRCHTHF